MGFFIDKSNKGIIDRNKEIPFGCALVAQLVSAFGC